MGSLVRDEGEGRGRGLCVGFGATRCSSAARTSACGVTACAQLAAAIAPQACHGLATADWLAADTGTPPAICDGRLWLPQVAGLGFAGLLEA